MILVLLAACVASDPPLLDLPVTAARAGPTAFAIDDHAITLTEATVSFADLRMEAPTEQATDAARRVPAHPGHGFSGEVNGELLGAWTIDLLGDPADLGDAACWAGRYATARLVVDGAPAARFAGTVTSGDDAPRPFDFDVPLDLRAVTGIDFEVTLDPTVDGLRLTIDPSWMLSFLDWGTPSPDDTPLTLTDGLLANSVPFGVISTSAWHLTLENP